MMPDYSMSIRLTYILESVIIAERFRNISWMQQRAFNTNDEELVVKLSNRGLPLTAGQTLLLTEKKSV